MYLRESRRRNKDGTVVSYLQLAHNERHPRTGSPVAKVIHNFGRADLVDREALRRLVASISRFLEPELAAAAAAAGEVEVLGSRRLGGAWVLDRLAAQHRVLVPEHQEFGILGHPTPGQHHQAAEQAAREQVDDREDHSAMIPTLQAAQAGSSNRAQQDRIPSPGHTEGQGHRLHRQVPSTRTDGVAVAARCHGNMPGNRDKG